MEAVLAWDTLESARETYSRNFSPRFIRGDAIEDVIDGSLGDPITESEEELINELGQIDMVVGGPPCQGHSDLNNHSRRKDAKNLLYLRMARFIEIVKPKIALIENVLTVKRAEAGVVQRTEDFLRGIGYGVGHGDLRAMDLGVPQDRRRHFTIATLGRNFDFASLRAKRVEMPRPVLWGSGIYVWRATLRSTPQLGTRLRTERIAWLFGDGWDDWEIEQLSRATTPTPRGVQPPRPQKAPCHQNGHNYPAVYGRMYPNLPAPTITTGFITGQGGSSTHWREEPTPHEAAGVQTFPDFSSPREEQGRAQT